ncbi:MAG: cytochrome c3 family protein [Bryobacteraceae bacterium]|nr:cytochrome c3 family protein [Bryobacteraceae bacterium]
MATAVLFLLLFTGMLSASEARCAGCHVQTKHVAISPMTLTLGTSAAWDKAELLGSFNGYNYRIFRQGKQLQYETRRGAEVLQVPVDWIFGSGRTGQTFILKHEGQLLESRVSYYPRKNGLDLTIGAANASPANVAEAVGRLMSRSDVSDCFGCHSSGETARSKGGVPPGLIAGVQCDRCHGDSEAHAAKPSKGSMPTLKNAPAESMSDLCGTCHRTWEQVMLMKSRGVSTVRFQPFRLSQSRCYDPADPRISCTACHDPHRPALMETTRTDGACQSCHAGASVKARPCPKASSQCASCHMPKVELPGAHASFSDHRIRVARAGEPYPD